MFVKSAGLFLALPFLCPAIGLPGGFIAAQEEFCQGKCVIKRLAVDNKLKPNVGLLKRDDPGGSHRLDGEPTRLPRRPVIVLRHSAMLQDPKVLMEDVRFHRCPMLWRILSAGGRRSCPLLHEPLPLEGILKDYTR